MKIDWSKFVMVYLLLGVAWSVQAAPSSWNQVLSGKGLGNVPFWIFLWPWPVAAQGVKEVTGEFPAWTPDV